MSTPNYTLDIVSHHPQFRSKPLRQYYVDGINTIGAYGDEPFEIRFKNNTYSKIQVKLSLDGTDIFTGKVADTDPGSKMWVVNGYDTLSLKAWCESDHGGASFVFTNGTNGVAVNTHGNVSSQGIIAAAVFTESYVAPFTWHYSPWTYCSWCGYSHHLGGCCKTISSGWTYGGMTIPNTTIYTTTGNTIGNTSQNYLAYNSANNSFSGSLNNAVPAAADGHRAKRELHSQAAVGAGEHVDQHISYVGGLVKPTLAESIRVRYMWWNELQQALRAQNIPAPHASGFPGDTHQGHVNLSGVPRVGGQHGCFRRVEAEYSRV